MTERVERSRFDARAAERTPDRARGAGQWNVLSCWYRNARAGSRVTKRGAERAVHAEAALVGTGHGRDEGLAKCWRSASVQSPPTVFDSVRERTRSGCASAKAVTHQPPID
jgi:hypothetical protein